MDFIESFFHLSPDGGNGTSEAVMLIALMLALTLCVKFRHVQRGRKRRASCS
jgi:hypothetical protein